jgi:FlaA1/EpsC-like NDP-sugar epimerase
MMFFDVLICGFSVWLAFGLRLDYWGYFQLSQWWVLIAAIGFSFPLFITFGLYRAIFRYMGSAALSAMARVFIIYTCLFFLVFTKFHFKIASKYRNINERRIFGL